MKWNYENLPYIYTYILDYIIEILIEKFMYIPYESRGDRG